MQSSVCFCEDQCLRTDPISRYSCIRFFFLLHVIVLCPKILVLFVQSLFRLDNPKAAAHVAVDL